jgi:8-oxo-dGTP pyrophosphatase MutT (NUDIX family)
MQQPRLCDFSAALLVDRSGRFLLQRRDNRPDISQPGRISFFGGAREKGENVVDCIVREIAEEIGVKLPPERFEHLISLDVPDTVHIGWHVKGDYFVARNIIACNLNVTEGALVIVDREGLGAIQNELTPITIVVLERFLRLARDV